MSLRLFVAINFPPALCATVWASTAPLRAAAPDASWVDAERLHLTLRFLGEVASPVQAALQTSLAAAVCDRAPFSFVLAGAGAFPNFRRPRVVWLGVKPSPELDALARDVAGACDAAGVPAEARVFSAHLTLARIRDGVDADQLARLRAASGNVGEVGTVPVHSVELMRSTLGATGSRYTVLQSFALGTGATLPPS